MSLLARDVMTPLPHTIRDDCALEQAKNSMYKLGVRHLPVLQATKIVGILSDRDIKLAYAVEKNASTRLVRDFCSADVYTVTPETPVAEMCERMARQGIGSTVIVDPEGHVAGIFTTTDACKVLARLAS